MEAKLAMLKFSAVLVTMVCVSIVSRAGRLTPGDIMATMEIRLPQREMGPHSDHASLVRFNRSSVYTPLTKIDTPQQMMLSGAALTSAFTELFTRRMEL